MLSRRRTAAVLSALALTSALMTAACGSDRDTKPNPTTATPTTTSSTTTADTRPQADDDPPALYRADLLLARGQLAVDGGFDSDGIALTQLDAAELARAVGFAANDNQVPTEQVTSLLQQLYDAEQLRAFQITDGTDPADAADRIAARNKRRAIELSPVLLTTISGHWTFAPGRDAAPSTEQGRTDWSTAPRPDVPVAVVDTGYSDDGVPDWLVERADPIDVAIDRDPFPVPGKVGGHGAFVASVIAQEAPQSKITVARLSNVQGLDAFWGKLPEPAASTGFVSDELQLYVTVARLVGTGEPFAALNLSLGSYGTKRDVLSSGFAIRGAVDLWRRVVKTPIYAAAGNHDPDHPAPTQPFLPAAYGPANGVFAVASTDGAGAPSDFSNGGGYVSAVGENLIGVRSDGAWWSWSGTSFATPIVTAAVVNGATVSPNAWFKPTQVKY